MGDYSHGAVSTEADRWIKPGKQNAEKLGGVGHGSLINQKDIPTPKPRLQDSIPGPGDSCYGITILACGPSFWKVGVTEMT